jgi:hypothetical protein
VLRDLFGLGGVICLYDTPEDAFSRQLMATEAQLNLQLMEIDVN